jgi:E3 ubiquitin-protein ligase MYCBP2
MIGSLNDNSTETFWESGDEDRNKAKWLTATLLPQFRSSGKGNIFFITVGDA